MPKWMPGARVTVGELGEDAPRVRQHVALVVGAASSVPAHESNSWNACAPLDSWTSMNATAIGGQPLHDVVPQRLVGVQQGLGVLVRAARPPSIR